MAMTDIGALLVWPEQYMWGDSGGDTWTLDAAEEFCGWVFTIPKTGTLKKIGWYVIANSLSSFELRVCLETVAVATRGQPVATTYAGKTLYAAGAESAAITSGPAGSSFNYTALNGTSGVSVTAGDQAAIVVRCVTRGGGQIDIAANQKQPMANFGAYGPAYPYSFDYPGSWIYDGADNVCHTFALEYDTAIVQTLSSRLARAGYESFGSGTDPNNRGIKFRFPFKVRTVGAMGGIRQQTAANDVSYTLFDSDEYTVLGTFNSDYHIQAAADRGFTYLRWPTAITLNANTWYRFAGKVLGAGTYYMCKQTSAKDGSLNGLSTLPFGTDIIYTTFNGDPSAGSHVWADDDTIRPGLNLVIDQIDIPVAGAGGMIIHPGMSGGING